MAPSGATGDPGRAAGRDGADAADCLVGYGIGAQTEVEGAYPSVGLGLRIRIRLGLAWWRF